MIGTRKALTLGLLTLFNSSYSLAEDPTDSKSGALYQEAIGVPFLFSSEDWGMALGGAGVVKGLVQPQMTLFGTVIGSSNGTKMGYLGLYNVMVPGLNQWQMDFSVLESSLTETNYFLPGNPSYPNEKPGSNDSNLENSVRTGGREQHYQVHFQYTLPIGDGKDGALAAMAKKSRGYESSKTHWNPMTTGITSLELQPYYQSQKLDDFQPEHEADESAGVRLTLEYDNRNSSHLPTRGSRTSFTYTYDWGSEDRPDWSTVEFEFSKFFSLGSNDLMNQQVLALNAWVADTPTWNDTTTINGEEVFRRAPSFAGINLGGWDKLRGYSSDRFYGRSAVSYSLEYRMMPKWQPLEDLPIIGPMYDIPWWQWTLFVDAGRVADDFDFQELHQDMKTSFGGGIRFRVEGVTVRTEVASGAEETFFRVFVNQPF
ncbi:BamA/TamA family outer membrane protein [Endozoicomonas elysicola]|uniref:BamA/TamA family outer membrane protein n=1 Tax=Endozoicomonas elysicola TaxID=305900 RepID=UPI00036FFE93|nr:BamA/TamA family outer membrane protein [Endozoicomonas elysicola]